MKIFLDDVRDPSHVGLVNDEWVIKRTVKEVKDLLLEGNVTHMSLDHDLGEGQETGYDLTKWCAEFDIWPSKAVYVHSANVVGRDAIMFMIQRYFLLNKEEES